MNGAEGFERELEALIRRWAEESDMTVFEIIGVLQYKASFLMRKLEDISDYI